MTQTTEPSVRTVSSSPRAISISASSNGSGSSWKRLTRIGGRDGGIVSNGYDGWFSTIKSGFDSPYRYQLPTLPPSVGSRSYLDDATRR
jgi:hypothetical protein